MEKFCVCVGAGMLSAPQPLAKNEIINAWLADTKKMVVEGFIYPEDLGGFGNMGGTEGAWPPKLWVGIFHAYQGTQPRRGEWEHRDRNTESPGTHGEWVSPCPLCSQSIYCSSSLPSTCGRALIQLIHTYIDTGILEHHSLWSPQSCEVQRCRTPGTVQTDSF